MKTTSLIIAGILGTALAAQADIIIPDTAGKRLVSVGQTGSGTSSADNGLNVGTKANNAGWDLSAGFVFQMAGASAGGDLLSADFSVTTTGSQGVSLNYNVDVWVNRVSSSPAFELADFQNGTKIMDDFVTVNTSGINYSLDVTGQANLLSYLQTNWSENDYVFITLKMDDFSAKTDDQDSNVLFGSGTDNDAQLTLTTAIPEPSALALLGLGGALLAAARRRKALA